MLNQSSAMIRIVVGLVCFSCLVVASAEAVAQRPGRLSAEEREALRPGVLVRLSSLSGEVVDHRDARMPAIFVAAAAPPSPLLPPGPFRATFTGYLKLPLRGEYGFSFAGRGAVKLSLNGNVVAEIPQGEFTATPVKVELVKGYNKLELEYESPSKGDAVLRLLWENDEFPAEPVSPELWSFDSRDVAWNDARALRHGRQLFAERHCTACHALPDGLGDQIAQSPLAMPELASAAPSLAGAGERFDAEWLRRWIVDPAALRNRTTMPRVLAHLDEKTQSQHATDIAAYLATLRDEHFEPLAANESDELVAQGEALFEDRGCIGCHRFTPASEDDEFARVSLHFVGQKFQAGALAAFLKNSHQYYAWNRMPKFSLDDGESTTLAAFLCRNSEGQLPLDAASPAASAERGRALFAEVGCANCHDNGQVEKPELRLRDRIAMSNLAQGCLAADEGDAKTAPRFGFTDAEHAALNSFLKTNLTSLARETPAEFSRRRFDTIGCKACHSRDGVEADLPYVLAEFGQLGHAPEPLPDLTWTGEKLRPDWTVKQFLGELQYRPRPHFHARMPAFPARAKLLAEGLSHEHGYAADEDPRPKPDTELAKTGEAVAAMNTGLACHRCHAIGDKEAEAPFEARSTNLSVANERLRYPFFHRWMRDPLRIDPQTKMIKFAQDGKKTGLTTIYDGDGQRQFDALWHYLHVLRETQPAKGDQSSEAGE